MTSQFSDMTSSSNFSDVVLFLLSSLVTGRSFSSISSLVLELWQFSFIRDWPEIRKLDIPPSEFSPIYEKWDESWVPNLARMFLIECYWMLQNSRITAFTILELLRENQLGEGGKITTLPHPDLGSTSIAWTNGFTWANITCTNKFTWANITSSLTNITWTKRLTGTNASWRNWFT